MKRVLVIGDAFADVYRDYSFKKECPDAAGVNSYYQTSKEVRAGGAANVALNIAALAPNALVDLIAVLDNDLAWLIKSTSQSRVDLQRCVLSETLRKERISLDGIFSVRLDTALTSAKYDTDLLARKLREYLRCTTPDAIVISDYASGAISEEVLEIVRPYLDICFVDTKLTNLSVFDGCAVIKLNRDEWTRVVMNEPAPEKFCRALIVTQGAEGAKLFVRHSYDDGRSVTHSLSVRALPVSAVDVCGCGDTFLAGLVASSLRNSDPFTAMQFANAAAATVVSTRRTDVADLKKTLALLGREEV